MIEFENEIGIDRPLADVYAFFADLENVPRWNYFVTQVTRTSAGPAAVGATYHQVRKTDSQNLRIVALEENQRFVVETIPPSKPELRRETLFSEEGQGTRIVDRWQLDTGHPGLLQKVAGRRVRSAVRENLGKLKELLETGQTTLQDGRRVSL